MATSVISNTITDPSGTAVSGVLVTATLMPTGGFRTSAASEVARTVTTTSNGSGAWTLTLERNSDITPSGTWYEIVEQIPASAGGRRVWNVTVGSSDQSVLAALTSALGPASSGTYLTQAAADARYQALGALGSGTPGTETPDHAGTAGVSTSAARADHIHPIAAAAAGSIEPDDAAAEGVSTSFARADHKHSIAAATAVSIGTANSEGNSTSFARANHVHTGAALGSMGYAQNTTGQGSIGNTFVDLTGLSVTFTAVAGRRYRIHASCHLTSTTAGDEVDLGILEGSTSLQERVTTINTANRIEGMDAFAIVTPSAGSHTYKAAARRSGGAGTVSMSAGSTFPAFILVEDIGT